MIPAKRIYEAAFIYTNSASTDLRATFARVRLERAAAELAEKQQREQDRVRAIAPRLKAAK